MINSKFFIFLIEEKRELQKRRFFNGAKQPTRDNKQEKLMKLTAIEKI